MQRAGNAVFMHIVKHYSNTPITIFCGAGNNAGDGYVVATLAQKNNVEEVVMNRNGFLYHGRVKALADAARKAGLRF